MSLLKKDRGVRYVVIIGLAAIIVGLLAACGSDPTPTPRPTATPRPEATSTPVPVEAETSVPDATTAPEPTSTPEPARDFWAELIEAAQAEGELVPVTTGGSAKTMAPMLDIFSEKFGISVSQQRGRGTDTVPKIVAERANGRFTVDTWQSGPGSANQIAAIGGMNPFEEVLVIPENRFKASWRNQQYRFVDGESMFMFAYAASIDRDSLIFNTNLVDADSVTSLQDQLKPEYVGRIARERVPQTDALVRVFLQDGGKEYLEALWSGGYIRLIEDVRQCEDALARGTVVFASCGAQSDFGTLEEQGLPVQEKDVSGFPDWRVGSSESVGMMQGGPNPNAAKLWINWLISPEGWEARKQTLRDDETLARRLGAMSLRNDVTNEHISDKNQIGPEEPLYILITDPTYTDRLQEAIEWIRPILVANDYPAPPDRDPNLLK